MAVEDMFRVWRGRTLREEVRQFEARVCSKCVLCADFGRGMVRSNICVCAGWGWSNNDHSPPGQANRGVKTVPGLLLNSISNATKNTNLLKRNAVYSCDRGGKVRISFRSKYGAAGGADEDREYAQIWERPQTGREGA